MYETAGCGEIVIEDGDRGDESGKVGVTGGTTRCFGNVEGTGDGTYEKEVYKCSDHENKEVQKIVHNEEFFRNGLVRQTLRM